MGFILFVPIKSNQVNIIATNSNLLLLPNVFFILSEMLSHIKFSFLQSSPFWFKKHSYRMFNNSSEVPGLWNFSHMSGRLQSQMIVQPFCSYTLQKVQRQSSCCLLWFGDLQTAATIPSSVLSVRVLIHCILIICFWAASVLKTLWLFYCGVPLFFSFSLLDLCKNRL